MTTASDAGGGRSYGQILKSTLVIGGSSAIGVVLAVVRNKLIDSLRRRGRPVNVPIDDVSDFLEAADETNEAAARLDAATVLARLKDPQRDIVRSISIEGAGIRETAARLKMTEVAVRVALHRALKSLAVLYRSE